MENVYQTKLDPWSSHSQIAMQLADFPSGTRILDVGTATGVIGRICQGKGFVLRGIEPVKEWVRARRGDLRGRPGAHA